MKIHLHLICLLTICCAGLEVKAQDLLGGFHLSSGIPVSSFKNQSGISVLPEVGISVLHGIKGSPLYIGGGFGYGRYGTAVHKRSNIFPGVNQRFRIRRNNNYVNLMGVVRLMPDLNSRFRPFVEGQIGGIHTFTRSHIRENRLADPIASGTEQYDWAMMFQAGAGFMVALNSSRDTFLELKVNYVDSGQMNYMTRSGASYSEQGDLMLAPNRSGFNMIQPAVAVRYFFD